MMAAGSSYRGGIQGSEACFSAVFIAPVFEIRIGIRQTSQYAEMSGMIFTSPQKVNKNVHP